MLIGILAVAALAGAAALCGGCGGFESLAWLWMVPVMGVGLFLALAVLTFLVIWLLCAVIRTDVPQEHDSPFYRRLAYVVVDAALTLLQVRIDARGLDMVPENGRFLLVCNHLEILDPLIIFNKLRKSQLSFIAKREVSEMMIVGKLMYKILCQPINRENDREALKTILKCVSLLKNDQVSVAVFPEGYTSLDFKLHPFRSGVFKIAQKANVPIVVCTLQNTQHIFHNAKRLHPTWVPFHVLGVIPAGELRGVTAVTLGERVHAMMAADLGPGNVSQNA